MNEENGEDVQQDAAMFCDFGSPQDSAKTKRTSPSVRDGWRNSQLAEYSWWPCRDENQQRQRQHQRATQEETKLGETSLGPQSLTCCEMSSQHRNAKTRWTSGGGT